MGDVLPMGLCVPFVLCTRKYCVLPFGCMPPRPYAYSALVDYLRGGCLFAGEQTPQVWTTCSNLRVSEAVASLH
jgi:hypothetical protein